MASLTPEETLSDMRGGFVSAGGLTINFGLLSTTWVNGSPATSLSVSSAANAVPQNLQQLVQVGSNNTFTVTPATLGSNVLTLIQNNVNNTVIQNENKLDVTVSNFSGLRNELALANSIAPLVRSLH
jgi:hypothetical protein